jgi:hypothetical protein
LGGPHALFPIPQLQDAKWKKQSLFQLQKDLSEDERLITRGNIRDQLTYATPLELGLITLFKHWRFQLQRAEERVENACAVLQIAAAIPKSSRNSHELERFKKEIKNTFESLFDPITADIGAEGDPIKQLIEKFIKELVIYHIDIREIEKASLYQSKGIIQLTKQDYIDCQEVATVAYERLANHIFSDVVTQQIYPAPCTVIVAAVATYIYHEIHRNNNAALCLGGHEQTDPSPPPNILGSLPANVD